MESTREFKKFNEEHIIFYSKSKNFNFYCCPFKGCKARYKEDIHSGDISAYKCHSGACYSNKKKLTTSNDNEIEVKNISTDLKSEDKKILNEFEREEKRDNNEFIKSIIIKSKMNLLPVKSKNNNYLFSDNYVAKILDLKETENLIRECNIHLSIKHPRIVNCLNYFTYNKNFYLITEYCSKRTLADFENGIEETKIRYLNEIIEAIEFLHKNRIVHRDVKLENIFIDKFDNIKLGDFGCVAYGDSFKDTQGTYAYMCPQMKEKKKYTNKCDVWSLGITSYCLLSGPTSHRSLNFLDFMEQTEVTKKVKAKDFKILIMNEIENLDFEGISDQNKENIMKMLEYEEEDRPNICEIKFI